MTEAGLQWIQLRVKDRPDRELLSTSEGAVASATSTGASIWLDDRPDLALLLGKGKIAGVHLGQEDVPPAAARRVVGEECLIGLSTHSESELDAAALDPDVDLIAVGPIFPTRSKSRPLPAVGLEMLRRVRPRTTKPLVAIGGIDERNLGSVLEAGANSVAVLSALCRGDIERNAARLVAAVAAIGGEVG